VRFIRAYTAVFSITLLFTTLPNATEGLIHARTITDAQYVHELSVDERLWLMIGGFVIGTAVAQWLYTRRRRGRLRAYELSVALFLGMWVSVGAVFAFATAEWGGLALTALTGAIAPLAPWTERGAGLGRRFALSALGVAALASMSLSSAQFLDSGFLFFLFSVPIVAIGAAVGIAGAEHIVEREHGWRRSATRLQRYERSTQRVA
jgi:hypothetical protein